ncbi:MAG: PorP/SprF family type IX secretion system membrane protein [Bacteroidota bacterium]|nr:PorP/SprF family type IX secretion system membrane protein [Bacteroidota bacterium]MEC8361818.1 PorP/SprF family type IX secretion system membrane protein [Bacteroidota bacterium]
MKQTFLLLVAVVATSWSAMAQQQLRRSQFVTNTYLSNPAVAGTEPGTVLSTTYRNQWAGFSGGPSTMLISGHRSLPNGIGAGLILYNDDMGGAISQSGLELTGAYSVLLNNQDAVSFGLSMKGNQFVFDGTDLEVYQPNDPSLPGTLESTFGIDFNAGMMVYGKDYYFGMAVFNLLQDKLNVAGVDDDQNRLVRHYQFMGSYLYNVSRLVAVQASGLMRMTEVTSAQLDVNVRAIVNGTSWFGMGFRPQDAFVLSTGLNYGAFTLAYNYDITVGDNMLSAHSHELSFGYFLPTRSGFRSRPSSGRGTRSSDRILK